MKIINRDWEYISKWNDGFVNDSPAEAMVQIPHTVQEMPLHGGSSADYQKLVGYRKKVFFSKQEKGKRQFLIFEGAAHIATLYFNGKEIMTHYCGYTAFKAEITELIVYDTENIIAVKLDTSENPLIPPFGNVVDYLTYGGIYRDVKIDTRDWDYIEDVFLATPDRTSLMADIKIHGTIRTLMIQIIDAEGNLIQQQACKAGRNQIVCKHVSPWSPEHPALYQCRIILNGSDVQNYTFGFRTVTADENHILLNGEPYFIRGLNRHQCFPYMGYAAADSLQIEDARILKEELKVNSVRTSHYPQSHAFLDACDRYGLLVFTEIPGWQYIGQDPQWKKQAVINTEEMIRQYRNHTCIYMWGVRINESMDDDELYTETNRIAHQLDPYRLTSGVRYLENSSLLEDVYSYNDFSHNGKNAGCKSKKSVMKQKKPLMITESNGHMFPVKSFDRWERRQEQALRHARVLDAAMKDREHAGVYQWCMFDYATHKDFGSGDRICYHGVMDAFRNPKLAASFYASQGEDEPILDIGSPMDIGDYDGGHLDKIYAFTNCDEVKLYRNDIYVKTFFPKEFKGLKHGPICIDDTIGDLLKTQENFTPGQGKLVHDALLQAQKYGNGHLPVKALLELAWCMLRYRMKYEEGAALYGKYVGGWGGGSTAWKFAGIKNGKAVRTVIKSPSTKYHLDIRASSCILHDGDTYDMAAFRIRILDEYDNLCSYVQLPISIRIEGPFALIGPSSVTAEGGMCGTYIRTIGKHGKGRIIFSAFQTSETALSLTAE